MILRSTDDILSEPSLTLDLRPSFHRFVLWGHLRGLGASQKGIPLSGDTDDGTHRGEPAQTVLGASYRITFLSTPARTPALATGSDNPLFEGGLDKQDKIEFLLPLTHPARGCQLGQG